MGILFDGWFPDGNAPAKLAAHAYMNSRGVLGVSPVVQVPGNLDLVADPLGSGGTVARMAFVRNDPQFVDASLRHMLLPITPTAADPITDWGGGSATSRRWYRFAFMHAPWVEEVQTLTSSTLLVVFQIHDQADTGDTYVEPPLWLKDDGFGGWELWNYSDPNAVTSIGTRAARLLCRIKKRPWTWFEFVVYAKWSWTSGDLRVWLNGNRIFQETGIANCFNHLPARGGSYNYLEYGAYGGKTTQKRDREVWHKGVQIGDEAYSTFDDFMIACGSPIRETRSFQVRGVVGGAAS